MAKPVCPALKWNLQAKRGFKGRRERRYKKKAAEASAAFCCLDIH